MDRFAFSSVLTDSHHDELTELVFFNRQQDRVREGIVDAIERYGVPELVTRSGTLRFTVGRLGEVQALYALDTSARRSRLAGVMLYARTAPDRVVLLHIGLSPEYSSRGPRSDALLALKLIEQLKKSCAAIKGVETIEILYGKRPAVIRVARG